MHIVTDTTIALTCGKMQMKAIKTARTNTFAIEMLTTRYRLQRLITSMVIGYLNDHGACVRIHRQKALDETSIAVRLQVTDELSEELQLELKYVGQSTSIDSFTQTSPHAKQIAWSSDIHTLYVHKDRKTST